MSKRKLYSFIFFSIIVVMSLAATAFIYNQVPKRPNGPVQKMNVAFPIGVFWLPPASKVTDKTMEGIKNFHANFILPQNGTNSFNTNDYVMGFAEHYGLKVFATDSVISEQGQFLNNSEPLKDNVLEFVKEYADHYKGRPGLAGFDLRDEPTGYKSMEKLAQIQKMIRNYAPQYPIFVNLSGYWDNYNHTGYTKPYTGETVRPNQPIGQTFRTKKDETEITQIQIWLDYTQFTGAEKLTMKIWDSPEKKKLIASDTLTSESSRVFTTFYFNNAKVKGNTEYYWEVVHDGGGDESVGWIVRTKDGEDWYPNGQGYFKDKPFNADFFFFVNSSFYENYVEQWASQKPDVLCFDAYPFGGGVDKNVVDEHQFTTLEIVRRQSLKYNLDLWSYMQSVGLGQSKSAPDEGQMRFNLYTHLAYGVKGIIYFTYYTPWSQDALFNANGEETASYAYAQKNNAELRQLGPTLKQITSLAVYHTGETIPLSTKRLPANSAVQPENTKDPYIISYFAHQNGDPYVMIVNRDFSNQREGKFTFKDKPKWIKAISKADGQPVDTNYNAKSGELTLSFKEGEGILLKLPAGYRLN